MEIDSDVCMEDSLEEEEDFFDDDDLEEEIVIVKSKKAKIAAAPKHSMAKTKAAAVLAPKESVLNVAPAKQTGKKKTVEEIYQKKTQLEHILLRPDTYIGSTERDTADMYVLQDGRIVQRNITFTPGLFKIFDEIIVNAADNKQRDPEMDKLEIDIDAASNTISVKNNGKGIPIVVHKEHGVYIPTLIFGHLLTGSNFDDDEKKTTGGRNGYGAKLANVFSTSFIVECVDVGQGLKFRQAFRDNMSVADDPVVKACTAVERKAGDYVKITFSPDLQRFGMTHLDNDTVALLSKRAYDIAGTMASSGGKKLSIKLNGDKLPIASFKDYLKLFDGLAVPVAYEKFDRWEVGISASNDASMHQVSFVNSICTSKGGGHVNYISDQIASHLVQILKKKKKKQDVKPAQVKNHLTIFVNCLIENPTFDSQTKDFLTSKPKSFGSSCKLSDKFLKAVEKSDVLATIESYLSFKEREALKRKGGSKKIKLTGIAKLDDANFAGSAKSVDCTLIITEGDSAKSLAMSGLSVVGRDYYGVFPLRGKPMNVRDSTLAQVGKNEEIKNLVEILGLKFGVSYDESNIKTLRYGHLMIMADQDTDGSHIKGLVINFIHHFWPTLLNVPGFLQQFITPIVKVSKGKKSISFFSLPEYQHWLESTGNNGKGYTMKYYKGLGTSTSAEAKEYFSHLDLHEVHFGKLSEDEFVPTGYNELQDGDPRKKTSTGSDLIDMVFRKDRVSDRKDWLTNTSKDDYLDYREVSEVGCVTYSDFINKEYIHFSNYDNERSIPHVMDGLKPSQRKILFSCFKRKLKNEIKVAQLTGYVAEHSAYHHGEASLQQAIIGMAQNFCGSNNINLLTPSGQFGTRRMGGKDAASPRYIFTCLEAITRAIFHPDDDELLNYLSDDGLAIEPDFYVPVIPMVLVNGAEGIGTGWSSNVNNYDARDIISNLRRKISGEEFTPMNPFYYGFTGEIVEKKHGSYIVKGKLERVDDTTIVISELPLKKWTQDYKQFLEEMMTGGETKISEIKDFKENHTDATVAFTITAEKAAIDAMEKSKDGLFGKFKLLGSLSSTNMVLFDDEGRLVKYNSTNDILAQFFEIRMECYIKRKALLVQKLQTDQRMLANKARFVEEVCNGDLVVSNRKRADLLQELQSRGYELFGKIGAPNKEDASEDEEEKTGDVSMSELSKGYDYLMGMKIWSLTYEKAEDLRRQLQDKIKELELLQALEPSQIWLNDLDAVEEALNDRDLEFQKCAQNEKRAQKKNQQRQVKASKKKKPAGRLKKDEWDSELENSDDDVMNVDSDSDGPVVAMPKAVAWKPAPKAAPVARIVKPSVDLGAKQEAVAPVARPAAANPAKDLNDFSFDSDEEVPLMERLLKKKLMVSPPANKSSSVAVAKQKRPSPRMAEFESDSSGANDESLDGLDEDQFVLASVTPAKKGTKVSQEVKRSRNTAAVSKPKAAKHPASKPKPAVRATAKKQTTIYLEDSSDSEKEEVEAPVAAPSRARSGRAAKQVKYVMSDDEEDVSDFGESD